MTVAYVAVITALSLMPSRDFPDVPMFPHADKVIHFLMYGLLAFLLCWAFPAKAGNRAIRFAGIILFCMAYGVLMELLQGTFTQLGRSFSLADAVTSENV